MKLNTAIIYFILFFWTATFFSQSADSSYKIKDSLVLAKQNKKNFYTKPRQASIMSAVLPGLGQIYNRKAWKVPIIYAGLGGFGYLFYINNTNYNNYRQALIYSFSNKGVATIDNRNFTTEQLQLQKLAYKKNRDFAAIAFGIMYLINVIDANVDAHLKTFDVSDDLSFYLEPTQLQVITPEFRRKSITGISLKLIF
jgi:hypothetical protein